MSKSSMAASNFRSIVSFSFGPIAGALLGLVTVPIVSWVFAPEDVGRLNILQISISFVLLLSVLGLDQAYVREYHEAENKESLLLNCFLPGFMVLLVMGVASLFLTPQLAQVLYGNPDPLLYLITLLAFFASYASRFLSLILRMEGRGWAYSASQLLPKIIQLGLVTTLAAASFRKEFVHLQLLTMISLIVVLLVYAWNTRGQWLGALGCRIDWRQLRGLLQFGFPLIFSGLAYWGLIATSSVALRCWSSLEELAVYAVANSFAGAAIVFQSIFSVIWAPTVYKWVSQDVDMKIVDQAAQQVLAVVCVIVALCGSLSWVCDWLLPERYGDVKYILLCMLMQPLLYTLSEVTCVGIGVQRRTMFTLWMTLPALATNLALSYVLIPAMGAAGAAMANAVAFTVFFMARTEISARIWRSFPRGKLYGCVAGLLVLAVGMILSGALLEPLLLHGIWVALLGICFVVFRTQWREAVGLIRLRKVTKA